MIMSHFQDFRWKQVGREVRCVLDDVDGQRQKVLVTRAPEDSPCPEKLVHTNSAAVG